MVGHGTEENGRRRVEESDVLALVTLREVPGILLPSLTFLPSLLFSYSPLLLQAEIIMMDNFTVVFRSGSDAHFYVVGDGNEVGKAEGRKERINRSQVRCDTYLNTDFSYTE